MTYPTYSIANDTLNGAVSTRLLHDEIEALVFGSAVLEGITTDGTGIAVSFDVEPSASEKTAIDNAVTAHDHETLESYKQNKIADIDGRTAELIAEGFTYSSKKFSLSIPAQAKMIGSHQIKDDAALTYPIKWNTIDDKDAYSIPDAADLNGFYLAGLGALRAVLDGGTSLKDDVRAATTKTAVDAVADNR